MRKRLAELSLEEIGKCPMLQSFLHDRFVRILSSDFGDKTIFPHDPLYLLVVHGWQSHFDASPTECALAAVKYRLNQEVIGVILVQLVCVLPPFVISTS